MAIPRTVELRQNGTVMSSPIKLSAALRRDLLALQKTAGMSAALAERAGDVEALLFPVANGIEVDAADDGLTAIAGALQSIETALHARAHGATDAATARTLAGSRGPNTTPIRIPLNIAESARVTASGAGTTPGDAAAAAPDGLRDQLDRLARHAARHGVDLLDGDDREIAFTTRARAR
jgi:hypothetical protein